MSNCVSTLSAVRIYPTVAVSLSCDTYNVTEGVDRTADIVIKRSGDLSRDTEVTLTPIAGTAQGKIHCDHHQITQLPASIVFIL